MVQMVLIGETNRTENLMGDRGRLAGGFPRTDFRRRDLEQGVSASVQRAAGDLCGDIGGRGFSRQDRELLLDRLKLANRSPELHTLSGIGDTQFENLRNRSGHLTGPDKRTDGHDITIPGGLGSPRHAVARISTKVSVRRDLGTCQRKDTKLVFAVSNKHLYGLRRPMAPG